MIAEGELRTIQNFLIKELSPYLVVLFGSTVENRERTDSDIDLAYLSDQPYSAYERFMKAQKLTSLLKREVDLIDLSQASTVLQMQILHKGKIIYCPDEQRKTIFIMKVYKMYAKLNEERQPILKEVKERGSVYGK